jgi:GAF domain-containing protein
MIDEEKSDEDRRSVRLLATTMVQLADTLADEYDVIEFLTMLSERCVQLIDVDEAGVMLADGQGILRVVGSSSQRAQLMELFEIQNQDGPCLDVFRTGEHVAIETIIDHLDEWPTFVPQALAVGISATHSVPMRLRQHVIGALNLFRNDTGLLDDHDALVAQALADIATIGLLHERSTMDLRSTTAHLQGALKSRVALEQAKGAVAYRNSVDVDEAFSMIRRYARDRGLLLTDVASAILNDRLDVAPTSP